MRLRAFAVVTVLLLASACGGSDTPTDEDNTTEPTADAPAQEALVAAPGGVGPVEVGMTLDEADATGLFESREVADDDPCKDEYGPIQWKAPNTDALMVDVEDEQISLLGVRDTVKTAEGIGVGSTFADVTAAYPGVKIEESQADGSVVYRSEGDKWLGMAFAEQPGDVKDSTEVVFMEASVGEKPTTYLSGCSY